MLRLRIAVFLLLSGLVWMGSVSAAMASALEGISPLESTPAVLGAIFAEQHVEDAALDIHRRALQMPPDQRFQFLSNWVLPSAGHATFRLAIDFSPTHPAPPARDLMENERVRAAARDGASRIPTGGELVSPALDLIHLAAELGRLSELRSKIQATAPQGEIQQRCQLALLGIADAALGDFDAALTSLDELFARVLKSTYPAFPDRWPETLAVHECLTHEPTRDAATEVLNRMLQSQVRNGVANGPLAWNRWVTAAAGRVRSLDFDRPQVALQNWAPVSRTNQWSRGVGMPNASWVLARGQVESVASHDDDFLFYRIPLMGDFEVECDVSGFGWRDTHLMVAGTYVAPIYDHVSYGVGSFRGERPPGTIDPRLTESKDWIRYRAVVRDGQCSTYFNGRLIHVEPLPFGRDPWLAIRSPSYTDGSVRNLRITGNPIIPDQLLLSGSPDLTGWHAYHGEPLDGAGAYWKYSFGLLSGGTIVGQRELWHTGLGVERLLQYQRPLLEDGTLEYEFFYRKGESEVYPSLDRQAFVIGRDGVHQHWITDGVFERTGLSPTKTTRLSSTAVTLRDNAWNRLQLTLTGDSLELVLNGQSIYRGRVDPGNQRTFGLFHWGDRTEALARNIVWRGDWPKALPPDDKQELASNDLAFLDDRLPELTAIFEHDFATDGLPEGMFAVNGRAPEESVLPGVGVRVLVRGEKGHTTGWLSPNLQLQGDFDVRARFTDLETSGPIDSSNGIFLRTITQDSQLTHSGLYRGTLRRPKTHTRQITQTQFNRNRSGDNVVSFIGETAEEATAGTLRLARRGNRIYCLLAEDDSPHFRLIHAETVAPEPTINDGIRLSNAVFSIMDGKGSTAVTWQSIEMRAESMTAIP